MNGFVKLAASIGILVMFTVVVGGVPAATAQQAPNYWVTRVRLGCSPDASAGTAVLLSHNDLYIGASHTMKCEGRYGAVGLVWAHAWAVTPYSAGEPNKWKAGVRVCFPGACILVKPFPNTIATCTWISSTIPSMDTCRGRSPFSSEFAVLVIEAPFAIHCPSLSMYCP
jgi:hypothetical protein